MNVNWDARGDRASCGGCGADATAACPYCQVATCGECQNCEHGPTNADAPCTDCDTEGWNPFSEKWCACAKGREASRAALTVTDSQEEI